MDKMFNKKKIQELEKEIKWKNEVAESRQAKLTECRVENDRLVADAVKMNATILEQIDEIFALNLDAELPEIVVDESLFTWIDGEPKEKGWYFVQASNEYKTVLYYNPVARCRWMRGELGNAERFEREVVAYMKAPDYEKES